jgi:hypothetical protein
MKQDKYLGLILVALSALLFWQAELLPPPMFGTLGTAAFPKLIFTLLGLGGLGIFIKALILERKLAIESGDVSGQSNGSAEKKGFFLPDYKYVFIGFAFFVVYVLLMYYLGYLISTLIFLPCFMWILGPRDKKSLVVIALVSLGLTFLMQFCFVHLLKVFLPSGALF